MCLHGAEILYVFPYASLEKNSNMAGNIDDPSESYCKTVNEGSCPVLAATIFKSKWGKRGAIQSSGCPPCRRNKNCGRRRPVCRRLVSCDRARENR